MTMVLLLYLIAESGMRILGPKSPRMFTNIYQKKYHIQLEMNINRLDQMFYQVIYLLTCMYVVYGT